MILKERMTLKKWYGGSIHIPDYSSANYVNFAGGCMGIVSSMIGRYIEPVQVVFNGVKSASADRPNGIININDNYLFGKILDKTLTSEQTLTILNGLILHEAGHFSDSPDDLTAFTKHVKTHTTCVYNEDIAAYLGNIVEDIWIEAEIERKVPSLHWMLEAMNNFFFSFHSLDKTQEAVASQESAPVTMQEVVNVMNMLLVAKIFDHVNSTDFIKELFYMIRAATTARKVEERLDLTLKLYDKLMQEITEEECKNADKAMLNDLNEMIEGLTAPHNKKGEKEGLSEEREILVKKVNRAISDLKECKVTFKEEEFVDGFSPTTLFIEQTPSLSATAVSADARYQRLAEIARQRAVVNRPYGQDRNRGNHIRKLYRIGTDNKIFAEPLPMRLMKPMQVMIVIDCSSSMSGERIVSAKRAALGAAIALTDARCEVGVFGHTADLLGGTEVFIYRFKDFNEPLSALPYRLTGFKMAQNRDSYAIQYLSKKMRNTRLRRLMIVISDGVPQAIRYIGMPANRHTKEIVDQARREGIDILSISITEEANATNNFIYGKENNVYNEDLNVIEKIVKRLVEA